MKVADLLTPDRIAASLRTDSVADAVEALIERLSATGALEGMADIDPLKSSIERGERVERAPVGGVLVIGARSEGVDDVTAALAIASERFRDGGEESSWLGAVLLLLTPRELSSLAAQAIPVLTGFLEDDERQSKLLACRTSADVRAYREFMELDLFERLKVEDALTPITYRIYPDTPLDEVVDLMVRKRLHAVPIVGEKYEVLGMITAGEALRHALPRRMTREGEAESASGEERPLTARDVMSRTVMCVSEDEDLLDAANLMVNKDVAQLPVVREGEIIGLLTRDRVLRTLFR